MKKITFLVIVTMLVMQGQAQQTFYYNFENSLNELNGVGPALTVLGNQGQYVVETLNEISGATKTVYRFEKNSGLQFNDQAAGDFLGNDYTIEIYFVFDDLTSWKRVVDWKNRKTDWGAYVYYGELNFYSILYSEEAPVNPGEYTYYVITRTGADNQVLIYTDAEVKISFVDNDGHALIDSDGVLNFFHDDLIVPNEATAGAVAMIKLYDYPLTQDKISENWNALGSQVFGINSVKTELPVIVYPNPAISSLSVDLTSFSKTKPVRLSLFNTNGILVFNKEITNGGGVEQLPVSVYPSGLYMLQIDGDGEKGHSRVVIR